MTLPSLRVLSYTQSGAGRVKSVVSGAASYVSNATFTAAGGLLQWTLNGGANAVEEKNQYNVLGQTIQKNVRKGAVDAGRLLRLTNVYGTTSNNGNLQAQFTETGTATYGVNFGYDGGTNDFPL